MAYEKKQKILGIALMVILFGSILLDNLLP